MFKNQSYKSFKENLDFVRSCSNWDELDKLSKTINEKFLLNSKYKIKLRSVEKKMNVILCDSHLPNLWESAIISDYLVHRETRNTIEATQTIHIIHTSS